MPSSQPSWAWRGGRSWPKREGAWSKTARLSPVARLGRRAEGEGTRADEQRLWKAQLADRAWARRCINQYIGFAQSSYASASTYALYHSTEDFQEPQSLPDAQLYIQYMHRKARPTVRKQKAHFQDCPLSHTPRSASEATQCISRLNRRANSAGFDCGAQHGRSISTCSSPVCEIDGRESQSIRLSNTPVHLGLIFPATLRM